MHIESLDVLAARRRKRTAKAWVAIEASDTIGQCLRVFRFHQNSVPYHLRHGRRSDSNNWFAGSHCFQKDDSKAFLHTGQAKYIRALIFFGQSHERHISEPVHDVIEAQFTADPPQSLILRSVAHDSNRELWNRCTQLCGRTEQNLDTLSGIKATYAQHSELILIPPSRDRLKYLSPGLEVDQLRYNGRPANSIQLFDT